jgi:hypothetical protein
VKKTRQNKNLEPRSDSIGTEKALVDERNSDVLGFDFLSFGSALGIVLGAAFLIIGWRQLQPP